MNTREPKDKILREKKDENTSSSRDQRLATSPLPRLFLQLAVPTILAQLINVLYNIVDRIYIGRIEGIGEMALTGVGVTFPILILISAFSQLIGSGGAPLAAIRLGKGEKKEAERMLGTGCTALIFISIICTIVFQLTKEPILMLFGASKDTVVYGVEYLSIYLCGTIFVQLSLGLNSFISCQGQSKIAMLSILIGAVLNIILDPIFIFGFHLGVKGAAIATVISQCVSSIWVVHFLSSSKSSIRLKASNLHLDLKMLFAICALGISPFIMSFTECLINVVFNTGLQKHGGDLYVGSMTIIQSIMQFMIVPINGFGFGIQPIISYNYGARNFERVRKTYRISIITSVILSTLACSAVVLFPQFFAGLFTDNEELLSLTARMLPIFVSGIGIFGLQMGCQAVFLGLGQAKLSLFLACLRKVILLIPLALILPNFVGVIGIYIAEPISDVVSALTAVTLFLLNIKKILSVDSLKRIA